MICTTEDKSDGRNENGPSSYRYSDSYRCNPSGCRRALTVSESKFLEIVNYLSFFPFSLPVWALYSFYTDDKDSYFGQYRITNNDNSKTISRDAEEVRGGNIRFWSDVIAATHVQLSARLSVPPEELFVILPNNENLKGLIT